VPRVHRKSCTCPARRSATCPNRSVGCRPRKSSRARRGSSEPIPEPVWVYSGADLCASHEPQIGSGATRTHGLYHVKIAIFQLIYRRAKSAARWYGPQGFSGVARAGSPAFPPEIRAGAAGNILDGFSFRTCFRGSTCGRSREASRRANPCGTRPRTVCSLGRFACDSCLADTPSQESDHGHGQEEGRQRPE